MDIEEPKVVSINGAKVVADGERRIIEELAMKVRSYVETKGVLPDVSVLVLFGQGAVEDENEWWAGYYSPTPLSSIQAYGIGMATLAKTLGQ